MQPVIDLPYSLVLRSFPQSTKEELKWTQLAYQKILMSEGEAEPSFPPKLLRRVQWLKENCGPAAITAVAKYLLSKPLKTRNEIESEEHYRNFVQDFGLPFERDPKERSQAYDAVDYLVMGVPLDHFKKMSRLMGFHPVHAADKEDYLYLYSKSLDIALELVSRDSEESKRQAHQALKQIASLPEWVKSFHIIYDHCDLTTFLSLPLDRRAALLSRPDKAAQLYNLCRDWNFPHLNFWLSFPEHLKYLRGQDWPQEILDTFVDQEKDFLGFVAMVEEGFTVKQFPLLSGKPIFKVLLESFYESMSLRKKKSPEKVALARGFSKLVLGGSLPLTKWLELPLSHCLRVTRDLKSPLHLYGQRYVDGYKVLSKSMNEGSLLQIFRQYNRTVLSSVLSHPKAYLQLRQNLCAGVVQIPSGDKTAMKRVEAILSSPQSTIALMRSGVKTEQLHGLSLERLQTVLRYPTSYDAQLLTAGFFRSIYLHIFRFIGKIAGFLRGLFSS